MASGVEPTQADAGRRFAEGADEGVSFIAIKLQLHYFLLRDAVLIASSMRRLITADLVSRSFACRSSQAICRSGSLMLSGRNEKGGGSSDTSHSYDDALRFIC